MKKKSNNQYQKNIRVPALRLLIYKFLAEKQVAVTLSDMGNAYDKADRTNLDRAVKIFEEKGLETEL